MSTKPKTTKKPLSRIDELEGLRGILALWVALSHIFCWCGFAMFPFAVPHFLNQTVYHFWVEFSFAGGAVDTFIILSGFAISYMLHARSYTYRQFMIGRFFRIYPIFLVCLLAGFMTIYLMPFVLDAVGWRDNEYFRLYVRPNLDSALSQPWAHLVSHLTLLFGAIPEKIILPVASATLLPPAWSISLEWQYYLLAPILALWVRRPGGILALGIVGCGGYFYSHFWGSAFLPGKLPLFLVGIGSFHLYVHAAHFHGHRFRLQVWAAALAATLIIGWHWVALLIWTIVFGGVLADGSNPAERFLLKPRQFLLQPAWQLIGKISYPLYLVHWPVIILLMAGLVRWLPGISSWEALAVLLAAGLPLILLAAWLLHKWVEKPLMQYGRKFS
jgi:peptidoglycan/LPS O-acetylase OafA/YrhL